MPGRTPTRFEIKDVADELIRDYQHDDIREGIDENCHSESRQATVSNDQSPSTMDDSGVSFWDDLWKHDTPFSSSHNNLDRLQSDGYVHLPTPEDVSSIWQSPVVTALLNDSVFLPGSAYLCAHSTFRSHLIHEVRSNAPAREVTPDQPQMKQEWPLGAECHSRVTGRSTQISLENKNPDISTLP